MKFTSVAVICAISVALLNGCSSLFSADEAQISTHSSIAAPELLTPLQTKVQTLQAKPNLYKNQASELDLKPQTLAQFQAALALKQQGNDSQARELFIRLSELNPNFSGIWLQLALLSKKQHKDETEQRLKDMTKYLNNAIAVNPLNYQAHNELALVLRQQGRFEIALRHYELALKSWPAFATAYLNRGILYDLYLGEKSLALADYELYKELSHDDSRQLKGWIIDLHRQIKVVKNVSE